MFTLEDHDALSKMLDQYPVPMFAAERSGPSVPFRLICVNAAHTRSTGLETEQIAGKRPLDILSAAEGRAVEARYDTCANFGEVINYQEELHLNGHLTKWQTTLMPVTLHSGADRVIGTALTLGLPANTSNISDAEYYAAQAQMRMGQIGQFMEMLQTHPETPLELRTGAMLMGGLTRSISHMMQDLRLSVRFPETEAMMEDSVKRLKFRIAS